MAKDTKKKRAAAKADIKLAKPPKAAVPKRVKKKAKPPKPVAGKRVSKTLSVFGVPMPPPMGLGATSDVLDRLWGVILSRRDADPTVSHSARLLSRGAAKCAQKFGEEAVECLIEAVAGNRPALIAESADVLYHMLVMWVASGMRPEQVWAELKRREGMSGIAEKAGRTAPLLLGLQTTKIP
jgi:phosphoribosyl-ATP pyrophosphohydrolase